MVDVAQAVRAALVAQCGVKPKDSILVAVSGGPDSVCMLAVLVSLADDLDLRLVVGHVNHGLRQNACRDEDAVRDLADSLGVPVVVERLDVYRANPGRRSIQMIAREMRMDSLCRMAASVGARWIALAHHGDDQAETVLMRILRGTSPEGLSGIRPVRDDLFIHPMLELSRRDVEEYLAGGGLGVRHDESNRDRRYLRNRIRLDLIPQLEREYNPQLKSALCRLAAMAAEDRSFLSAVVDREWEAVAREELVPRCVSVDAGIIGHLHPAIAGRILIKAARRAGVIGDLPAARAADLWDLVVSRERSVANLPGLVVAERHDDRVYFCQQHEVPPLPERLAVPGQSLVSGLGLPMSVSIMSAGDAGQSFPAKTALECRLDAGVLGGELEVRLPKPGDRIEPLGMEGEMTVASFLAGCGIPRSLRPLVPLVISHDRVAWAMGCGIGHLFRVTEQTINVAAIRVLGKA